MSEDGKTHGYKIYWILWAVLLVLTVTMITIEGADLNAGLAAVLLLMGSAVKATLIIFYYMHLRFEKFGLVLIVLVGIFVTSILMFVVPAYDGTQILERTTFR